MSLYIKKKTAAKFEKVKKWRMYRDRPQLSVALNTHIVQCMKFLLTFGKEMNVTSINQLPFSQIKSKAFTGLLKVKHLQAFPSTILLNLQKEIPIR